jgi:hypothetical protein
MNSRPQAKNNLNLRVKQAGQLLAQSRWTDCDTRVSPAGMAGSGNVCADFWNPDHQLHTVYLATGSSSVCFRNRTGRAVLRACFKMNYGPKAKIIGPEKPFWGF